MGLAGFNRMRRARRQVEELEAERFKKDNAARWAAHHGLDKTNNQDEKLVEKIRSAEADAMAEVGAKAEAGIKMGEKDPAKQDLPLRQDHAAEIAGRSQEHNQEPKDPVERLRERIPDGSANEELVGHMGVSAPGPDPKLVEAARIESLSADEKAEEQRRTDRDAELQARVAGQDAQDAPAAAEGDASASDAEASEAPTSDAKDAPKADTKKDERDPLDHDGDGKKGGGPVPKKTAAKK